MLKLAAAIVLATIARQGPAAATDTRTCAPNEATDELLGPAGSTSTVDLYLDPIHPDALPLWLELRRLVHDHEGEVSVRAHIVRGREQRDRRVHDPVRAWVLAAASHRRLLPALRVLAREGPERVHARLNARDALEALAREIDIEPSVLTRELEASCALARLEEATDAFAGLDEATDDPSGAMPVFVVDGETVIRGDPRLERLRPELSSRGVRPPPESPLPALRPQGRSPAMVRPAIASGIKLGGVGLPHRMLILASGEQDPSMHAHLESVLRFRADNPGLLSVQIVARGRSLPARLFADRLCVARGLGRELDYARYLAEGRAYLRAPSPWDAILLRELDEADARGCDVDEGDRRSPEDAPEWREGLRDGPWIDGTLGSGPDLDHLDRTLRLLEAAQRPLGPLLSPPSRAEP